MNREQYIQTRSAGQIDLGGDWELYLETPHHIPKLPPHVFNDIFPMALQMNVLTMELYFRHYDNKFNVVQLIKKDGNVLFM